MAYSNTKQLQVTPVLTRVTERVVTERVVLRLRLRRERERERE